MEITTATATIVVPAHDEASVVTRCLEAVLKSADPEEFDVLVVSNGSTDDTAERARATGRSLGHQVTVVEIAAASKIRALRAAADVLGAKAPGTRIYLDADVVLSTEAARELVAALLVEEPRMALAALDVSTEGASWLVRSYYRAWNVLPYMANQGAGSGVFAVNAAGIPRITPLPDVINDDGYVASQFSAGERVVVAASFRSDAARSGAALVRRRARIVNGNRELDELWPSTSAGHAMPTNTGSALRAAVRDGRLPVQAACVFVAVTMSSRLLAAWRRRTGSAGRWSMDLTTRKSAS